jgi:aminomethyltransferase
MVPFAGWEMPIQHAGIIEEHNSVRRAAGMFDVSHMCRFWLYGPEAGAFLRYICTYDITRLSPGQGHYAVICNAMGGIMDDVFVYRLLAPNRYLLVVNAANADKIRGWFEGFRKNFEVTITNVHTTSCMIAVQGPQALERLSEVLDGRFVESLRPRACGETVWENTPLFASRTGYTGEDGLELVVDVEVGPKLWRSLKNVGVQPCGLGARDTLRLEAALLLYGNDMNDTVNPFEVGLSWVVTLDDGVNFMGRNELLYVREHGIRRKLVCLKAEDKGVMRHGHSILRSGKEVGKLTSGGHSPTLGISIGMGLLPQELAVEGTKLTVDVRGHPIPVQVVPRPFYRRPKAGGEKRI